MRVARIPPSSRRWSRCLRARLGCRRMRCRTRPSTRSPLARRPEADTCPAANVLRERRIIMTIVRWNPFNAMDVHQERMSRMFEAFYGRPQEDLAGSWVPAVDIYSNGQHELVHVHGIERIPTND